MLCVDQGLMTPKMFVLSSVLSCNPAKLYMWRNYNYNTRRFQRSRYEGDFRPRVRHALPFHPLPFHMHFI